MTIPELLEESRNRFPEKMFLSIRKDSEVAGYTYEEVYAAAHILSSRILESGLRKGDRVALVSENRPEWGVSYLAILGAGCTVVPLDTLLTRPEHEAIIKDSGSTLLVCSEKFRGLLPAERTIIMDGEEGIEGILRKGIASVQSESPGLQSSSEKIMDSDIACFIYTSGTTGRPKGITLTHRNIVSNVRSIREAISVGERDTFLSVLPLYHTFECTAGFLVPLSEGARVHYASSLKSKDLIEDMKLVNPTIMLGVPLLYEKLLIGIASGIRKAPLRKRFLIKVLTRFAGLARRLYGPEKGTLFLRPFLKQAGLGNLRFFVSGASRLPDEVALGFRKLGIIILEGYGLSEASPVLTVNRPDKRRIGSVGPPIPGVEIRIDRTEESGVGEIIARGENIMLGYFGHEKETREVLINGWLRTGDLGWIDAQGNLHIAGRAKNVIVTRAGKNVYPEEIEGKLSLSPFIKEVLVYAGESSITGREEVHAEIFPALEELELLAKSEGVPLDKEKISELLSKEIKRLTAGLAEYKRIKKFTIRDDEFPKTSTRKIKRFLVKKPGLN